MNTIELQPTLDNANVEAIGKSYSILKKLNAFIENQKDKRLAWFMIGLLAQAVLILPIPAALIYYYDASVFVLAITLVLFFANIIAGMGGSKIGILILLLTLNIIVHLVMICGYILFK
ncbi:hypothetical protein [Mucilaginibacter panaciglaebae]|uniref:Uncharacterized protein n=1 Tax=Mucilaginibacter panaciglaebae TaxID=502331 RepID=A0ABP7WRU1_9SPHI